MTEFEQLVHEMRQAQRNYFRSRENRFLAESKRLESEVDKYLRARMEAERQPRLFDNNQQTEKKT